MVSQQNLKILVLLVVAQWVQEFSMAAMNAGYNVIMIEQNQGAIDKALEKINSTYERNVKLGRITSDQKQQNNESFFLLPLI